MLNEDSVIEHKASPLFILDYRVLIRLIDDFLLVTPHLMQAKTFLRYDIENILYSNKH